LQIELVWVLKQRPELNAMDQLWRELKRLIAANRQAVTIENLAQQAADWVMGLSQIGIITAAGWSLRRTSSLPVCSCS
jgi:hypothetical protein